MKHFSNIEWIDFVNGATQSTKVAEMQKHLDSNCKSCLEVVSMWRKVHETGAAEQAYQPPATDVRIAKAIFTSRKKARAKAGISLVFDSFFQPALAGTRSAENHVRQLLYRIGAFQLDLCVEATSDGKRIVITGQLMNAKNPALAMRQFPILVSDCQGLTLGAETNEFGEFRTEIANTGAIELKLHRPYGKHYVVSMREVLGIWTGSSK